MIIIDCSQFLKLEKPFAKLNCSQSKVLESHARAPQVALPLTPRHPVEPAHVDSAPTPERRDEDDPVERVAHPLDVVAPADVEVGCPAVLAEPDVDVAHGAITGLVERKYNIGHSLFYLYVHSFRSERH